MNFKLKTNCNTGMYLCLLLSCLLLSSPNAEASPKHQKYVKSTRSYHAPGHNYNYHNSLKHNVRAIANSAAYLNQRIAHKHYRRTPRKLKRAIHRFSERSSVFARDLHYNRIRQRKIHNRIQHLRNHSHKIRSMISHSKRIPHHLHRDWSRIEHRVHRLSKRGYDYPSNYNYNYHQNNNHYHPNAHSNSHNNGYYHHGYNKHYPKYKPGPFSH